MSTDISAIFRECIDVAMNARQFDRILHYYHEDCLFHVPPYIGVGIYNEETSDGRLIVEVVTPGGPADKHLQPGDEIVHVRDASGEWSTFKELRSGLWGQGKAGTSVTLTIRRGGKLKDIQLQRGKVVSKGLLLSDILDGWRIFLEKDWPDLRSEINLLISQDDKVAYFITNSGTNGEYHQFAIWTESGIVRFKDGKIAEWWSTSDDMSQIRQLGYKITAPVMEPEKAGR